MARKSTNTAAPLHRRLLEGFDVKSRKDGTVHTIRAGKTVVAEVCVGKRATRLNVRAERKTPKGITLSGESKSWPSGGVVVTEANLADARALLTSIASAPQPVPATPAPRKANAPKTTARKAATTTRTHSTRKTTAA
ncbi:MAG TPA: hypothetical protein VGH82_06030 [Gaiellaceae bacterium]|jgi:hypothetical protein